MGKKPNILFICTDQQAASTMSCAGNPDIRTPAMDSLAENGVRFEQAYCTQPLCCPARASFATGLMPHQTGVVSNDTRMREDLHKRAAGSLFRDSGYDCAYAGKWHIPGPSPDDLGFQALSGKGDASVSPSCLEFLSGPREKPFLLVASYVNPHDICQWARSQPLPEGPIPEATALETCPSLPTNFPAAPFSPDMLRFEQEANPRIYPALDWPDEHWRRYRYAYYRLVEKVDAEIGVLLDGLRQAGLEEDTLIVFSSDHGDGHGAHKWNQKTAFYEECIRLPLIVSLKGVTRPGATDRAHLVSLGLDLIPTICDFAGIEPPAGLEGLSLRGLAEGREPASWRDQLAVETYLDLGLGSGGVQSMARAMRTQRFKYSVYAMGRHREQLVDLEADPGEMVNLALDAGYREVLSDHRRRLLEHCRATDDPFERLCMK